MNTLTAHDMRNFWTKVEERNDGCWEWTAALNEAGYGKWRPSRSMGIPSGYAHRFSYTYMVGEIPEGLHLDHLCRNKACVNPDHLDPVTPKVNVHRAVAIRTHCPHGHEFTPENTFRSPNGRKCRTCNAFRLRQLRARKSAERAQAALLERVSA